MANSSTYTPYQNSDDPEGVAFFDSAFRRVNDTYGLGLVQNDYQRSLENQNYSQQLADLRTKYQQTNNGFDYSWAHRGMMGDGAQGLSGVYQNAWDQNLGNQGLAQSQLLQRHQLGLSGLDKTQQGLEDTRTGALADLGSQEQARQSALAAMIRGAQ